MTPKPYTTPSSKLPYEPISVAGKKLELNREVNGGEREVSLKVVPGVFNAKAERQHVRVTVEAERVLIHDMRTRHSDELIPTLRATLTRAQWNHIAVYAEHDFNAFLSKEGLNGGRFQEGENILSAHDVGRELLVLAWAVETLEEPQMIGLALGTWATTERLERWWLHRMTVSINGRAEDRGKGWRAALMHMMTATPSLS